MKIFVTGATGFLGTHFVNQAHSNDYEVVALRRSNSIPRIKITKEPIWVEGNLGDKFQSYMRDCDALVHFASYGVTPQPVTLEEAFYWNVTQSMKTLEMAIESGIDRIIIAGSALEYGLSSINHEFIPVTANLEPVGPYAISKVCLYFLVKQLCLENHVKMSYLRVFSAFCEGQYMGNLWPSLKASALKGEDFNMTLGEQVRDFICVDKAARIFIDELKCGNVNDKEVQIKNVGTGVSQTVLEFSKYWWDYWNASGNLMVGSIPYRSNEIMRMVPKI